MDPYPDSQSLQLAPLMQAVFADIQGRNIQMSKFEAHMTPYPPPDTDPGLAYALSIFDRFAHMTFHRYGVDGNVEVYFGTGGLQYGPKRLCGRMVLPYAYLDLLSLLASCWITFQLSQMGLLDWSLKQLKSYYPSTVVDPRYTNLLRTFCFTVLGIAEDSFTSLTNNVGHATDVDLQ